MMRTWKFTGRTAVALLLLLAMGLTLLLFSVLPADKPEVERIRALIRSSGRVVHATGFLTTTDGRLVSYANSVDGLENLYALGNRVCEIDIKETRDGALICAHGDEIHIADGVDLRHSATLDDFMSTKVYGEFRPTTVEMVAEFMRKHKDLYVITDIRGNYMEICRRISEAYPDLRDQFIIQIYHEDEYEGVAVLGFPYIIYTLYRATDKERNIWRLADYADTHELVAYTIQTLQFYSWKNRVAMAHTGVPFMFFTIDDPEEIEMILRKSYVGGIYTNLTT